MKQLEKVIRKNGFEYHQINRTEKTAIYEQRDNANMIISYEVFYITEQKGGEAIIAGKKVVYDHKERFPSDEDFGNIAWSYSNKEKALQVFDRMNKKLEKDL